MTLIRLFLLTSLSFSFVINSNAQEVSINNKTPPQNSSAKNNVRVALDDYFRKAAGLGFSGAILVAKDGEIIARKSYGWADVKRQIPIRTNTIFDIGSGVKAFTATAIMQLEEQGKLNASDPITKYFKDVPADKANITIPVSYTHLTLPTTPYV